MEWGDLLNTIVMVVVLPLITILANYLIKFIDAKIDGVKAKTTNETTQKYLDIAEKTLTQCIQNTTETFVKTAKESGEFNQETAEKAYQMSKDMFLQTISKDVQEAIQSSYNDVDAWLKIAIESRLANLKTDSTATK